MHKHFPGTEHRWAIAIASAAAVLALLGGCENKDSNVLSAPQSARLAAFQAMARQDPCADLRNRLFLIDDQLVFWDRLGSRCGDIAYEQTLFGETPQDVLCRFRDSLTGPRTEIVVPEYAPMFRIILAHLDEPDLGLGKNHSVTPIAF